MSSSKKKSKAPRTASTNTAPSPEPASVHEGVATRGDGTAVRVSVPRDEREAPPTRQESERLAAKAAATVFGPEVLGPAPETPTTTGPAGPDAATTPTPPAKGKKGGKRPATGTKAPGAKPAAAKAAAPKTAKAPKTPKAPKAPKERKPKRVSLLDCAAQVLAASKEPMSAKEIVADVLNRKMWSTTGETPEATLYAAMIREIAAKKSESRFKKVDRGMFVATGK
ncbi:MAG: winged helix-turn-helix domain-containing protein [Steroidobacteraceae bacterium]